MTLEELQTELARICKLHVGDYVRVEVECVGLSVFRAKLMYWYDDWRAGLAVSFHQEVLEKEDVLNAAMHEAATSLMRIINRKRLEMLGDQV